MRWVLVAIFYFATKNANAADDPRREIMEKCDEDSKGNTVWLDPTQRGLVAICAKWVKCVKPTPGSTGDLCDGYGLSYSKTRWGENVSWSDVKTYCCKEKGASDSEGAAEKPKLKGNGAIVQPSTPITIPDPPPPNVQKKKPVPKPPPAPVAPPPQQYVAVGECPAPGNAQIRANSMVPVKPPVQKPALNSPNTCEQWRAKGKKCTDEVRWEFDISQSKLDIDSQGVSFNQRCCSPKPSGTCEEIRATRGDCRKGFENLPSPIVQRKPVKYVFDCWRAHCCREMGTKDFNTCGHWEVQKGAKCKALWDNIPRVPDKNKQTEKTTSAEYNINCCKPEDRRSCSNWFSAGKDCSKQGAVNVKSFTATLQTFAEDDVYEIYPNGCCEFAKPKGFKLWGRADLESEVSDLSQHDALKYPNGIFSFEDDSPEVEISSGSHWTNFTALFVSSALIIAAWALYYFVCMRIPKHDDYFEVSMLEDEF